RRGRRAGACAGLYSTNNLPRHYDMSVLDKGSGPGGPPEPDAASGPGTPPEPDAPADAPDASRRERRRARTRRRLGRGGIAVVIVLALIGAWSSWGWLTATPE